MKYYKWFLLLSVGMLAACSGFEPSSQNNYTDYNCTQIAMEKQALSDDIVQENDKQNSHQIIKLAKAAFALSNGQSYDAKPDSASVDHLQAQYDSLRHEAIRKQCMW